MAATGPQLRGVNRAGAEYGDEWDGWTGQIYYEWARDDLPLGSPVPIRTNELNYFASKGMNVIRLPISWERLQHTLNGPLDTVYRDNLKTYVTEATSNGFAVIIDLHNYGRYATGAYNSAGVQVKNCKPLNICKQHILGDGTLTFAHIADVWTQIATLFVSNPRVIFNLMNEQHDANASLNSTAIFNGYQTVLDAIRKTGAKQLILFPNTRSSDTHHWSTYSPQGGPHDSVAALSVKDDSANNFAFDMHSYPGIDDWNDGDLEVVEKWARAQSPKKCLFLSEFGTTKKGDLDKLMTKHLIPYADVWVGWTVWNLKDKSGNDYRISVTDKSTGKVSDTPKMAWYKDYFKATLPSPIIDHSCHAA